MMANAGKTVIVAALDGTFQRKVKHLFFSTAAALGSSHPSTHPCCLGTGLWEHPEPGAAGRERGEAERRVHGVLQRSLLHREAGSREVGEFPWNRKHFSSFTMSPQLV